MKKKLSRNSWVPTLPRQFCQKEFLEDLKAVTAGDDFASRYLESEMLSKYVDNKLVPAAERRAAALAKWQLAEDSNDASNARLMFLFEADFGWTTGERLLEVTRRFVAEALGPLRYPDVISTFAITNGASTRVQRSSTAAFAKLSDEMHITESALKHWFAATSGTRLSAYELKTVPGSVLFTVPKRSDIDRVACKEPEANMMLQRSVGLYLQRRLKRFGIDLTDQSRNQGLARRALAERLATIDLSSASDTISSQLVRELLPFDWWSLLDDLRSHETYVPFNIDGTNQEPVIGTHEYSMFSSMGNGFTFELESLLFWCITRAVMYLSRKKGVVSVYGDDIICPSLIVPRLVRIFSYLGFKVNKKKTHSRGLFRESCGAHFYDGRDVTPFYIRGPIKSLFDFVLILNQAIAWMSAFNCLTAEEELIFYRKYKALVHPSIWGGQDHQSGEALVTGDEPRKRLSLVSRPVVKRRRVVRLVAGKKVSTLQSRYSADQQGWLTYWLGQRPHLCTGSRLDHKWLPAEQIALELDPGEVTGKYELLRNRTWERSMLVPELLTGAW